jgi:hypothetical protein
MLRQINDNVIAGKLPKDAKPYILGCTNGDHTQALFYTSNSDKNPPWFPLPPGKWKILGKLDELTDENKRIVLWHWEDISGRDFIKIISSGKLDESFQSFLNANQIYSVNPLGEKEPVWGDYDIDGDQYLKELKAWQESESNTGDWLIILREGE